MLEIIKELLPLLEGAKSGAIWLVAAYFGLVFTKLVLFAGVVVFLGKSIISMVLHLNAGGRVEDNNWNMYQWDEPERVNAIFTKEAFKRLLEAIGASSATIGDRELNGAADIIRKARTK